MKVNPNLLRTSLVNLAVTKKKIEKNGNKKPSVLFFCFFLEVFIFFRFFLFLGGWWTRSVSKNGASFIHRHLAAYLTAALTEIVHLESDSSSIPSSDRRSKFRPAAAPVAFRHVDQTGRPLSP